MATSAAYIDLDEGAAPATPAANKVRVYAKTDGLPYSKDDAGAETPMGGAGVADILDLPTAEMDDSLVLAPDGAGGVEFRTEAGASSEIDYVENTSSLAVTATTEAGAQTAVSSSAIAYDGSTTIIIEFYSPIVRPDNGAAGRTLTITLWDGSTDLGRLGQFLTPAAATDSKSCLVRRRLTPTAATHTYHIKAFVNVTGGLVAAGAGGTGVAMPMYIRITRA